MKREYLSPLFEKNNLFSTKPLCNGIDLVPVSSLLGEEEEEEEEE